MAENERTENDGRQRRFVVPVGRFGALAVIAILSFTAFLLFTPALFLR